MPVKFTLTDASGAVITTTTPPVWVMPDMTPDDGLVASVEADVPGVGRRRVLLVLRAGDQ